MKGKACDACDDGFFGFPECKGNKIGIPSTFLQNLIQILKEIVSAILMVPMAAMKLEHANAKQILKANCVIIVKMDFLDFLLANLVDVIRMAQMVWIAMRMANVHVKSTLLEKSVINAKMVTRTFLIVMNVMPTFLDIQTANPVLAMKREVKALLAIQRLEIVTAIKMLKAKIVMLAKMDFLDSHPAKVFFYGML